MIRIHYRVTAKNTCALIAGNRALAVLPQFARGNARTSVVLITDRTVARLHGRVLRTLREGRVPVHTIVLRPGERSKELRIAERCLRILQQKKVDRYGILVALGGGVVGDLTGFVASVYLRGIDYIEVPTTLLAQVDSGIGGKTGVDFRGIKNVIGTFHQPKAVVCDTTFLRTLPQDELINGMAEVIKYGLIGSRTFTARLEECAFNRMPWDEVVGFCVRAKAAAVARDPNDRKGERVLLNFGHTVGHALESMSNFLLPHGKAIAIGMVAAVRISNELLGFNTQDCARVESLLAHYNLPTRLPARTNIARLINILQHDKKAQGGSVRWVLLEKIGKARAGVKVPRKIVHEALRGMFNSE
ncbi:MAG: 3-dehydroquinate synthase [Patescibacteria group bacterium]